MSIPNRARAEAGMLTLAPERIAVREVLDDVVPTLRPLFEQDGLRMSIQVPRLPAVHAGPSRLRTIVANLLDNAIKYTPPGGRIGVRARRVNGEVEIAVSDTGVGVPPEARDSIFEPVYRAQGTAPARGQPSTGPGLALEAGRDGGSTFRFTIPVAPAGACARVRWR